MIVRWWLWFRWWWCCSFRCWLCMLWMNKKTLCLRQHQIIMINVINNIWFNSFNIILYAKIMLRWKGRSAYVRWVLYVIIDRCVVSNSNICTGYFATINNISFHGVVIVINMIITVIIIITTTFTKSVALILITLFVNALRFIISLTVVIIILCSIWHKDVLIFVKLLTSTFLLMKRVYRTLYGRLILYIVIVNVIFLTRNSLRVENLLVLMLLLLLL